MLSWISFFIRLSRQAFCPNKKEQKSFSTQKWSIQMDKEAVT